MTNRPMNRRFTLESGQLIPDGAGGHTTQWVALGQVYGALLPGTGREVGAVELKRAETACRIRLRAAPPGSPRRPKPDQRLREGARIFSILAVADEGTNGQYLTCFAVEEAAQ